MTTPIEIAPILGEVYFIRKDAEDEQKKLRLDFFEAASQTFSPEGLAQKTLVAPPTVDSEAEARAFAEQYNPGWIAIEAEEHEDGGMFAVTIQEDPAFLPYSIVVEVKGGIAVDDPKDPKIQKVHPGYVISRTIVSGSLMMDIDRLEANDQDLYLAATYIDNYDFLADLLYENGVHQNDIDEKLEQGGARRLPKNPDDMDEETLEAVKSYLFEGPKQPKLNVRYAKDNEIGEG